MNTIKKKAVLLNITIDDCRSIYVDGTQLLKTELYKIYTFKIDSSFKVIAIFVINLCESWLKLYGYHYQ